MKRGENGMRLLHPPRWSGVMGRRRVVAVESSYARNAGRAPAELRGENGERGAGRGCGVEAVGELPDRSRSRSQSCSRSHSLSHSRLSP